jgi:hypothetical protein
MIVTEKPTKSLAATDGAVSTWWCEAFWRNQPIVKTLVIPFPVVVCRECGERLAQVSFAEDECAARNVRHDPSRKGHEQDPHAAGRRRT